MRPRIGETVHWRPWENALRPQTCRAAIVTGVRADGMVELAVLASGGLSFEGLVVHGPMMPDGDARGGTWHALTECVQ